MSAGLVTCWLIRFMVVLYIIVLIMAYLPFWFMWAFMMCVGIVRSKTYNMLPLPH